VCCLPVTNSGLAPLSPGVALGRRQEITCKSALGRNQEANRRAAALASGDWGRAVQDRGMGR
jgi:hypothetical protein